MSDFFSRLRDKLPRFGKSAGSELDELLDRIGVPIEKRDIIKERLNAVFSYTPKIGVLGKTGVGKSSLCNAVFGQDLCPISDVESCTRDPQEVLLNMGGSQEITLLDVPGVGESQERDKEYANLYAKLLPELDLALWVLKADDRAFSSDEKFYKNIVKPHIDEGKPFFFVLNQVDKIEPSDEWKKRKHCPGDTQLANIEKKVEAVAKIFGCPKEYVIPVSANEKYNLSALVAAFIFALPREKKFTVGRNVKLENISEDTQREIKKSFWDTFFEIVGSVWEGVKEFAGAVWEGTKEAASAVWEGLQKIDLRALLEIIAAAGAAGGKQIDVGRGKI